MKLVLSRHATALSQLADEHELCGFVWCARWKVAARGVVQDAHLHVDLLAEPRTACYKGRIHEEQCTGMRHITVAGKRVYTHQDRGSPDIKIGKVELCQRLKIPSTF